MTPQLVNWEPNKKHFVSSQFPSLTKGAFLKKLKAKSRPKEIEDLVAALTKMWTRIGAAANCGKCFQGKLSRSTYSHGCCGGCPNLGETGCIAKPIGCALYTCRYDHFDGIDKDKASYFRGAINILNDLVRATLNKGYYADGYLRECEHNWTKSELWLAKSITRTLQYLY